MTRSTYAFTEKEMGVGVYTYRLASEFSYVDERRMDRRRNLLKKEKRVIDGKGEICNFGSFIRRSFRLWTEELEPYNLKI